MPVAAQAGRRLRSLDRPALAALGLGLAGVVYRLVLLLLTVPGSNSDEATFGLAALHIAERRGLPVFLYGQHYMGTLESYLAAPLFAAFGPSWVLLRLPLLLLYAAFLAGMYRLTRQLYSPWLATFTVGLLALGSERVIRDQLTAVGGRPEIKPAIVLLLLITLALARRRALTGTRRWLSFGAVGLLAGLSLWSDWLALPYLAGAAGLLAVGCRRDLLGRASPVLLVGFGLGISPLILDNLVAPPGQDSLSVLEQVSTGTAPVPLEQRLVGAVLTGIPLASGLCPPTRCGPGQMSWGVLYVALLVLAGMMAVAGLRARSVQDTTSSGETGAVGARLRSAGRLALVVGAGLALVGYVRNPLSGTEPLTSARYLSILQISLPAVVWPLWLAAARTLGVRTTWRPGTRLTPANADRSAQGLNSSVPAPHVWGGALAAVTLTALAAVLTASTAALVAEVGTIRAEERRMRELATAVQRAGVRYVYGEYWTCNRLTFVTEERVVCAVLGRNLRPGQDRYPLYRRQVRSAARPAFLFRRDASADASFRSYLDEHGITASVTEIGDYHLYQPTVSLTPWR